jgi:hypothetical protein
VGNAFHDTIATREVEVDDATGDRRRDPELLERFGGGDYS